MVALRKLKRGDPSSIPYRYAIAMVAQAHGKSPEEVREWPADDFADALNVWGLSHGS